jgi:hypothetical protein
MNVSRSIVVRAVWALVLITILVTTFPIFFLPWTFSHLDDLSWSYAPAVVVFRRIYLLGPILPVAELIYAGVRFRGVESEAAGVVSFLGFCLLAATLWFLWTMAVVVSIFLQNNTPL